MSKLVIVTSDLLSSKELINQCIGKISSLRIIAILTNLSELESYKKHYRFDFLLFHNVDYAESLKTNYDIITIGNFKTPSKKYDNRISLSNTSSTEFLRKQIEKFTKKVASDSIRKKSTEILLELGFNFKHVGSKYLVDAICYSYMKNYDSSFENLEKAIYPYIAKLNHTQVENVKWSIARTINLMYLNHTTKSIKIIEEYFCLDPMQKPTPKQVIGMIRNKILFSNTIREKNKDKTQSI